MHKDGLGPDGPSGPCNIAIKCFHGTQLSQRGTLLGSRARTMPEQEEPEGKGELEARATRAIAGVDRVRGADHATVYYIIYLRSLVAISCSYQYGCISNQGSQAIFPTYLLLL